jgi:hypothetical protein
VTSQKPDADKKAHELTTDEAMERLFHPHVVKHAKEHARVAEERATRTEKKPTTKD